MTLIHYYLDVCNRPSSLTIFGVHENLERSALQQKIMRTIDKYLLEKLISMNNIEIIHRIAIK